MIHSFFEDLVASLAFANLPKLNQKFILETMLGSSLAEAVSTGGDIAFEGAAPEVVNMEYSSPVPTALRSPSLKPTPMRETQKTNKDR